MTHQAFEFAQNAFSFYEDPLLGEENCPDLSNPDQSDRDLDGAGDPCDCAPNDPDVQEACAPCAATLTGGRGGGGAALSVAFPILLWRRKRTRPPL